MQYEQLSTQPPDLASFKANEYVYSGRRGMSLHNLGSPSMTANKMKKTLKKDIMFGAATSTFFMLPVAVFLMMLRTAFLIIPATAFLMPFGTVYFIMLGVALSMEGAAAAESFMMFAAAFLMMIGAAFFMMMGAVTVVLLKVKEVDIAIYFMMF